MIKGISETEYQIINSILSPYKDKYEFYFYGSRVKGDFRDLSDLDILIKGKNCADIIENLEYMFDKSNLPYVVNISDFNNLNKSFYDLIEKDLVKAI